MVVVLFLIKQIKQVTPSPTQTCPRDLFSDIKLFKDFFLTPLRWKF